MGPDPEFDVDENDGYWKLEAPSYHAVAQQLCYYTSIL